MQNFKNISFQLTRIVSLDTQIGDKAVCLLPDY
jgi:hypothetical protein